MALCNNPPPYSAVHSNPPPFSAVYDKYAELPGCRASLSKSSVFLIPAFPCRHVSFLHYITTPSLGSRTQATQGCNRMTCNPANNAFMSGACHNAWCTKHACNYLAIISTFPFDPLVTVASFLRSSEYYCRDLVEFTVIYNICYIERYQTHVIPLNPMTRSGLLFLLHFFIVCECVCQGVRGQLTGVSSRLPPCRSGDHIQVIVLGGKLLYQL